MHTPGVSKELQGIIRKFYEDRGAWPELSERLGITLKSVQHMLDPKSPRDITYHFCGLLAVKFPSAWDAIVYMAGIR